MATYDSVAFGRALRTHRLKLGWSAYQLSECYAEFVGREDSPPGPTFIYHLERGTTMISLERRAILASLVGMPLALLSIPRPDTRVHIDISEYTQALERYGNKWRDGTIQQEALTIQEQTSRLEAVAFQTTGRERKTLLELFGFYQILHADVYSWRGQGLERSYTILSCGIETARQEKHSLLLAHTLTQRAGTVLGRFETTKDPRTLQTAIDDYSTALQEKGKLSPFYSGLLDVRRGLADAYMARDNKEFTNALHVMTQGSHQIGVSPDDVRIIARLDYERYMLNRASAYLYSPMGNAKLGLAELKELDRWCPQSRGKPRSAHRNRLFAQAYLATGDYPMAAAYLEAGLEIASGEELNELIEIHARLKDTPYWNDPDVGRITVKINQMKYPDVFH